MVDRYYFSRYNSIYSYIEAGEVSSMSEIRTKEIDSLEDIEFELIKEGKMKSETNSNYVNNKELYKELCKYHDHKMDCLEKGKDIPPLTNKIGEAILQIATRRCNSWMYRGYTNNWKEEMIGNAVIAATLRGHNFDPSKSENPFAYFTQICDNAIKEQLKREKREMYIRYKSYDNARGYMADSGEIDNDADFHNEEVDIAYEDRLKFISEYEEKNIRPRKERSVNIENQLDFGDDEDQEED